MRAARLVAPCVLGVAFAILASVVRVPSARAATASQARECTPPSVGDWLVIDGGQHGKTYGGSVSFAVLLNDKALHSIQPTDVVATLDGVTALQLHTRITVATPGQHELRVYVTPPRALHQRQPTPGPLSGRLASLRRRGKRGPLACSLGRAVWQFEVTALPVATALPSHQVLSWGLPATIVPHAESKAALTAQAGLAGPHSATVGACSHTEAVTWAWPGGDDAVAVVRLVHSCQSHNVRGLPVAGTVAISRVGSLPPEPASR